MTLRLDEHDKLLSERARSGSRSKYEIARKAIHMSITDRVRQIEDLEDALAIAQIRTT